MLSLNPNISWDIINNNRHLFTDIDYYCCISKNPNVPWDFIKMYPNRWNWAWISERVEWEIIKESTNKKIPLQKNELVKVILQEGKVLYGFVEEVNGDVVWLKSSMDGNALKARFNFKIDQFIRLN